MLILIELRPLYHFCGRVSPEKRNFWEHFANFQVQFVPWIWHHRNMKYRNGRTYFVVISENVVNFDEAPYESAAFTNLFSRRQNEHFENNFFFVPLQQGKKFAAILSLNHRVVPRHNAKPPRVGLQRVPLITNAAHMSITCFDVFDDVISCYFKQWPQSYPYGKYSPFCDIRWKIKVYWMSDAPSGFSYIYEGSKNPLLETESLSLLFWQ